MKELGEIFEKRFGKGFRLFAAPGRINLIGEHTDYNYGYVLPGAIDMCISLAIRLNSSSKVRLHAADLNQSAEFDLAEQNPKLPGWALYPFGVTRELQKIWVKLQGFDAVFGGNIPHGAGLSSSAALESVFAFALNELNQLNLPKDKLAKVGQLSEHLYVGVKCGIMDQFASLFGKQNQFIRLDCRDLSFELFPFVPNGYKLLLADTGVKHSLASTEYNTRRMQCEDGVLVISTAYPQIRSLRDVTPDMLRDTRDLLNPIVYNRCEYVVEENMRVLDATKALKANDIKKLGELLFASHEGLRDKYEVSCVELDTLVEIARETDGVAGARMMGGGFGGCTLNLLKANAVEDFKATATAIFSKEYGRNPHYYEVSISEGAREIK
jgi:galactokinase